MIYSPESLGIKPINENEITPIKIYSPEELGIKPIEEPTGKIQSGLRSLAHEFLPATIGGGIGAGAGQPIGRAIGMGLGAIATPFLGPEMIPLGGTVGQILGGFGGAMYGTGKAEELENAALRQVPEFAKRIGQSEEQLAQSREENPYSSAIGAAVAGFGAVRPNLSNFSSMGKFLGSTAPQGASALERVASIPAVSSGIGAGIGIGGEAYNQYAEGKFDPGMLAIQGLAGGLGTEETSMFKRFANPAKNVAEFATSPATKRFDALYEGKKPKIETDLPETEKEVAPPGMLLLPAPDKPVLNIAERDPLLNPVGRFTENELTPDLLKYINDVRDDQGKPPLKNPSLEDVVEAGAPQQEIDRLLAYKNDYIGDIKHTPEQVLQVASLKNVDTTTQGFTDFLRRATGSEDLNAMSQPQLNSALNALSQIPKSPELMILPQGTNASRFTTKQYDTALKGLGAVLDADQKPYMGKTSVIQEVKDFTGLTNDNDAKSLIDTAIRNGDLESKISPRFEVINNDGTVYFHTQNKSMANSAAKKLGLNVREGHVEEIGFAGEATQLPGGPDIRVGTFKQGETPAGFQVTRGDHTYPSVHPTAESALAHVDRLNVENQRMAATALGGITKAKNQIERNLQTAAGVEAKATNQLQVDAVNAKAQADNKLLQDRIDKLTADHAELTKPLEIKPSGMKPVTRQGYTYFENDQPHATFPSQVDAEQYALSRLPVETLNQIIESAPSQKGLMPKRLSAMAQEELRTRQGTGGIEIKTNNPQQASKNLANLGIYTPEVRQQIEALRQTLVPTLNKLGLEKVALRILHSIENGSADGEYVRGLITIALDSKNPLGTLRHESIHALKELGAFTDKEWSVLTEKAKGEWLNQFIKKPGLYDLYKKQYEKAYGNLDGFNDYIHEEAIAEAFKHFDKKKPAGLLGNLTYRLNELFTRLGNVFRGHGFESADSIFNKIEEGGYAPNGEPTRVEPRFNLRQEEPRKIGSNIVGAPPELRTEQDRTNLVNSMTKLLSHPYAMANKSKEWYERSGKTISDITRGDKNLTEKVLRLTALYSQANSLGGNITAVIKTMAQIAKGELNPKAGRFPNTTAELIPGILSAKEFNTNIPGVEDKLMNFYRNLHDAAYGTNLYDSASTIDRWMMRLFGYPHAEDREVGGANSVSATQYKYAKDLINRISDKYKIETGEKLLPRQIQSVLWTYVKNMSEFEKAKASGKEKSFEPTTSDFSDYLNRATANITWESRPSTSIDLLPGIHDAPRAQQEEFNRAVRGIFEEKNGENKIFKLLNEGILHSSQNSIGGYENKIAPNVVTKVVLEKNDKTHAVEVANKAASIIGYVTKQDAVPWYRADHTASGKNASVGFKVNVDASLTPELEENLFKHLDKIMPGVGFTKVDNSLDFINFRGEDGKPFFMKDKQFEAKLKEALQSFKSKVKFDVTPFRTESNYISNNWKENKNGSGYLERFSPEELAHIQPTIDGWRSQYDAIANEFGKRYGWDKPKSKFSLRPDELTNRPGGRTEEPISLGERQEDSVTHQGIHYGKVQTNTLSADKYGTGLRGAEGRRLDDAWDDRIKRRVYFYIPKEDGSMPNVESGVGHHVHTQTFENLAPMKVLSKLMSEARGDSNTFESLVVEAGYDGYAVPNMGMMVILNHDVPTNYHGTVADLQNRKFSLRAPDTKEFKQFFGDSEVVDSEGNPKVMYHGTARDISTFKPKQARAIFVTENPKFAENFSEISEDYIKKEILANLSNAEKEKLVKGAINQALKDKDINPQGAKALREMSIEQAITSAAIGNKIRKEIANKMETGQNIMPVFVRAEKPFDYENLEHLSDLKDKLNEKFDSFGQRLGDKYIGFISRGGWDVIEKSPVQAAIRDLGHDGFYVKEGNQKNLAVYDPAQIKSATGNIGTYDRANPDIRYSLRNRMPDEINEMADRITTKREEKGFVERFLSAISPDAEAYRKELGRKVRQGLIFQFDPIEEQSLKIAEMEGKDSLLAHTSAIASVMQSMTGAKVTSSSFLHGIPEFRDGFTTIKKDTKGLIPILEPLMEIGKGDPYIFQLFQLYAGAKRAKRLNAEGREQTFTPEDIKRAAELEKEFPEFKQVFDEYQVYNNGLVKFMKDTGVLSAKDEQKWTENWDYIPFFRQIDDEHTVGPKIFGSISGVAKPKKLKGGEAPLADFLETVTRNARAAIESGMKNEAANRVVRDSIKLGTAEEMFDIKSGSDIVNVKVNGETKYYRVADPLMTEALKGLNVPQMPLLALLSKPSQLLRNMVTKDPGFILANLSRDSLSAYITSGTDMMPIVDSFKQFGKILANKSPEAHELVLAGLGGNDYSGDIQTTAKEVSKALRERTGNRTITEKGLLPASKLWDMLEHASQSSELATRAEVYKQTLERTGSEAEAVYQAHELMNFDRRGGWAMTRIISSLVPFLNARVQGLDLLYRAGYGKMATENSEVMKKAFISRSLQLLGMTAMYWYMVHDTPEYKKLSQSDKDNYWIIPGLESNGKPFKFPIPFELGSLFKVLPERIMELTMGNDTGKDFAKAMGRQVTSTLSFNLPQFMLPALENEIDYSFFTGQPIVPRGKQDLEPQFQYNEGTSAFAKKLGAELGYSPLKIDHLIQGYTGTMGLYATQMIDSAFTTQGEPVKATTRFEQLPVVKRFFAQDSGTLEAYHELANEVKTTVNTLNFLERSNDIKEYKEYEKSHRGLLGLQGFVNSTNTQLKQIREYRMYIEKSKMSADEKRAKLDRLHEMEVNMTKNVQSYKKKYTE